MLTGLQGVVDAEAHGVVTHFQADATLPGEVVHHLGLHFIAAGQAGEGHVLLGLDVAGGRDHAEVDAGLEGPAAVQGEVLGKGHAHREGPDILMEAVAFQDGAAVGVHVIAPGVEAHVAHADMRDDVQYAGLKLVFGTQTGGDGAGLHIGFQIAHAHAAVHLLLEVVPGAGVGDVGHEAEVLIVPAGVGAQAPESHIVLGAVEVAAAGFGIAAADVEGDTGADGVLEGVVGTQGDAAQVAVEAVVKVAGFHAPAVLALPQGRDPQGEAGSVAIHDLAFGIHGLRAVSRVGEAQTVDHGIAARVGSHLGHLRHGTGKGDAGSAFDGGRSGVLVGAEIGFFHGSAQEAHAHLVGIDVVEALVDQGVEHGRRIAVHTRKDVGSVLVTFEGDIAVFVHRRREQVGTGFDLLPGGATAINNVNGLAAFGVVDTQTGLVSHSQLTAALYRDGRVVAGQGVAVHGQQAVVFKRCRAAISDGHTALVSDGHTAASHRQVFCKLERSVGNADVTGACVSCLGHFESISAKIHVDRAVGADLKGLLVQLSFLTGVVVSQGNLYIRPIAEVMQSCRVGEFTTCDESRAIFTVNFSNELTASNANFYIVRSIILYIVFEQSIIACERTA